MASSAFILVMLFGTSALPPAQSHVVRAAMHVGFDIGFVTVSASRTVAMETAIEAR